MNAVTRLLQKARATAQRPVDVLGIGECSADLVLKLPTGVSLSQALPDKLSATGFLQLGGGQIATAMVAAQRLGLRTALSTAVGDDARSAQLLQELAQEGVQLTAVQLCAGLPSRTALLLVDATGDRRVLEWRDPGLNLPTSRLTPDLIASARVLHVDLTYPEASLHAAALAKQLGTLISVDLDQATPEAAQLLALADLCVVSEEFPKLLTGQPDPEQAALHFAKVCGGLPVVTRGAAGCIALLSAQSATSTAPQLTKLVVPALTPPVLLDTTACGDTFHAALIAALLQAATAEASDLADQREQQQLTTWLHFACAAAALKCRDLGRRGCPTAAEVAAFIRQHPARSTTATAS
ncbi:MAG TPA: carbohydrate kinase family protein [Pseudomonadota bacterium]|nr:carbohydrate kinase family protein [Pseudomonadota bacterium]